MKFECNFVNYTTSNFFFYFDPYNVSLLIQQNPTITGNFTVVLVFDSPFKNNQTMYLLFYITIIHYITYRNFRLRVLSFLTLYTTFSMIYYHDIFLECISTLFKVLLG